MKREERIEQSAQSATRPDPRRTRAARYLIVSVHDVTQHCTETVSGILFELEKLGIPRTSLL
ncbi:MAG: hypothetical protein SNJ52_01550, partial [Verrucomicrobiia bacterium]